MQIIVHIFGPEAHAVGKDQIIFDSSTMPCTCAHIRDQLSNMEPKLVPMIKTARIAVNHEFAADATEIAPGDEIALIGMVGGG